MAVTGQLNTVWDISANDRKTKIAISRKGLQTQAKKWPRMLRKSLFSYDFKKAVLAVEW
jgi:Tfp pilus assembly protein FimT